MADKKISELVSLAGKDVAATDLFPVVDVNVAEIKSLTRDELRNAVNAIQFAATKALATTAAASLPDDTIIEVAADESLAGARTRYTVTAGALVFSYGVVTKADLADASDPAKGAALVGYDGGDVQDVLDDVKPMSSYSALRAYSGRATGVQITSPGIAGIFRIAQGDTTSADNGGSIIVSSNGKRWVRDFQGFAHAAWWGIDTLGIVDSTAAIQAACEAHLRVMLPDGDILVDGKITLRSGHLIKGAGINSTKIIAPRTVGASSGVFTADSGSASAKVKNIRVQDFTIDGQSNILGFSEFKHLISLNGVDDVCIERVRFNAYRGDGVYIGSGLSAGVERHNTNVTVRDCEFDGVNKSNRNGITVIDGDGIHIINNQFRNSTQANMPGAIDVEPDGHTFSVVRNIRIEGNDIRDCGGASGSIVVYLPLAYGAGAMTTPPKNIAIRKNTVLQSQFVAILVRLFNGVTPTLVSATDALHNVVVEGNTVEDRSIVLSGIRGLRVCENETSGNSATIFVGSIDNITEGNCVDARVEGNACRDVTGIYGGITIGSVSHARVSRNTFFNVSQALAKRAICLLGAPGAITVSDNVSIFDNYFFGVYDNHIYKSSHTETPASTYIYNNTKAGGGKIVVSASLAYSSPFSSVSGSWSPVLYDTGGGGLTITQTSTGSYTRMGEMAYVSFSCAVTALSGVASGGLSISGLPFPGDTTSVGLRSDISISNVDLPTGVSKVGSFVGAGLSVVSLQQQGDNIAESSLSATALKATSVISASFIYKVA